MKTLSQLVVIAALVLSFLPEANARRRPKSPPPQDPGLATVVVAVPAWELSFEGSLERVAALRGMASTLSDRHLRKQMSRELDTLADELRAMRQALRQPGGPGVVLLPPGHPGGPGLVTVVPGYETEPEPVQAEAMRSHDFRAVLESMDKHSFADDKLRVLEEVAARNLFLVAQVQKAMAQFSFGDDRLKALELLAPRIVDPENNFRIYESFTFDSEKDHARQILSRIP